MLQIKGKSILLCNSLYAGVISPKNQRFIEDLRLINSKSSKKKKKERKKEREIDQLNQEVTYMSNNA